MASILSNLIKFNHSLLKVQENIHVFGGNKDEVTIFGESAGGWSVSFHIVSPLSKGLFKKGIIQSGTIFTEKSFTTKNDGVKIEI